MAWGILASFRDLLLYRRDEILGTQLCNTFVLNRNSFSPNDRLKVAPALHHTHFRSCCQLIQPHGEVHFQHDAWKVSPVNLPLSERDQYE